MSKKNTKNTKRIPRDTTPKPVQAMKVFNPMYSLIADLNKGEVSVEAESNLMILTLPWTCYKDLIFGAAATIRMWNYTWDFICNYLKIDTVKSTALNELADVLDNEDIEFHERLLFECKAELDVMFKLWMALPLVKIQEAVSHIPPEVEEPELLLAA